MEGSRPPEEQSPPLTAAEVAEEAEAEDNLQVAVGIAIAVTSILGAIFAWQAAVFSNRSSDLEQLGTQQTLRAQQLQGDVEGAVSQDLRLFGSYQEYVKNWRLLQRDSKRLSRRDPQVSETLGQEAKAQLSLARSLLPLFSYVPFHPGNSEPNGDLEYFKEDAVLALTPIELQELNPSLTFDQADEYQSRALKLEGTTALSIVGLVFLTLAALIDSGARRLLAISGGAISLCSLALFMIVEWVI